MFDNIINFFKKFSKKEETKESSNTAKERLHLVLMQDRANVSADFLELMRQEIIEVIKKYIDIDEGAIDVKLTNKTNEDGTVGAPALYANIPIITIKNEARKANVEQEENSKQNQNKKETAPKQEETDNQGKEESKAETEPVEKKEEKPKTKKAENKEGSKEDVKEEQEEKKAQTEKKTNQEPKKQIKKEPKKTEKQVAKK